VALAGGGEPERDGAPGARVRGGEEHLVADQLDHATTSLCHRVGGEMLELGEHCSHLLRRQPLGQCRRPDQVDEADAETPRLVGRVGQVAENGSA
jgi:hypothetical protein